LLHIGKNKKSASSIITRSTLYLFITVGTSCGTQSTALVIAIELDKAAHGEAAITAAASSPGAIAKAGSSILANHIKHVPAPAPSKSNGGAAGKANTMFRHHQQLHLSYLRYHHQHKFL